MGALSSGCAWAGWAHSAFLFPVDLAGAVAEPTAESLSSPWLGFPTVRRGTMPASVYWVVVNVEGGRSSLLGGVSIGFSLHGELVACQALSMSRALPLQSHLPGLPCTAQGVWMLLWSPGQAVTLGPCPTSLPEPHTFSTRSLFLGLIFSVVVHCLTGWKPSTECFQDPG